MILKKKERKIYKTLPQAKPACLAKTLEEELIEAAFISSNNLEKRAQKLDMGISKLNTNKVDTNKPSLFSKKSKVVISKPLTYIDSDTGKTRHFTPAAQEWHNSIYTYNGNNIKNLPSADNNLMALLKSYFNGQLNKEFLKTKFKPLQRRYKRLSTKRTFVGKGHLKHTSSKVIITFFVYNAEGMFLSSLFRAMNVRAFFPKKRIKYRLSWEDKENIKIVYNRWFTLKEYFYDPEHKGWYYSYIISLIEEFTNRLEKVSGYISKITDITSNYFSYPLMANHALSKQEKVKPLSDKLMLFDALFTELEKYNNDLKNLNYPKYNDYKLKSENHYLSVYNTYGLLLRLNKIKFNDTFLSKLIYLVKKIYGKKIEFNIVNLKKMHLNSDIYTQAVTLKLRNKSNKLYRILKASLRKVKLPTIRRISEKKESRANKNEFLVNNIRNKIISFMFKNDSKDPLNSLLLYFYPSADNIKIKRSSVLSRAKDNKGKQKVENKGLGSISLTSYVRNWLKHMNLRGIRIEAKGRLTKRAIASRSVFKMKLKGGLKNVDSSYRRLSTIMLRGHAKSNVQYSLLSSKNRNGAFGIKGWVSSK